MDMHSQTSQQSTSLATTKIKICGLRSIEMIQSMIKLPIDYIGFVFAPSKRQVTAQQVKPWVQYLQSQHAQEMNVPKTVGVFVNPSIEELREVMELTNLDYIQLHGNETSDFCQSLREQFGVGVIKSMSIRLAEHLITNVDHVIEQCEEYRSKIDALLLDTHDPLYGGGSGKTFAWDCIPPYRAWSEQAGVDLFVAGGLHADNVSELILNYRPHGVDISSGVETNGVKDIKKINLFVERVLASGSRS
jgi:phosphoribosylanthranilate isomerase